VAPFLEISRADFYGGGAQSYAKAWLLVHLLKNGPSKYKELYRQYMTKLETMSGVEATRAVFDAKVMATIDADLETYRNSLKTP
jgi:hypothetical protein